MPRLRLLTPMPELAQCFHLHSQIIRIGREVDNDIVLPHPTVSRYHAVIQITAEGIRIEDRGSSNGTFYNGDKVERAWLKPGDHIFLGKLEFKVEEDQLDFFMPKQIASPSIQVPLSKKNRHGPNLQRWFVLVCAGLLLFVLGLTWYLMIYGKRTASNRPALNRPALTGK